MTKPTRLIGAVLAAGLWLGTTSLGAWAQDATFIQIQSVPSLAAAQRAARDYAGRVADVNGFRAGRWYVIAIGPFTPEEASARLRRLRAEGRVPRDSYLTDARRYGRQFWPIGATTLTEPVPVGSEPTTAEDENPEITIADIVEVIEAEEDAAEAPAEVAAAPETEAEPQTGAEAPATTVEITPEPEPEPEETVREARASEAQLTRDQKKELQVALRWAGFYQSAIDGAYGRGTRRAMSDWQEDKGYEATGVLTTRQRAELIADYNSVFDGLGFEVITDDRAGVTLKIPTDKVTFAEYETPFVKYEPAGDEPIQVLIISQEGDRRTLGGLYEIMQTLELVPAEGPRERSGDSFSIVGDDGTVISETYARHQDGRIKGFTLVWPSGDERRRARVIDDMKASFAESAPVFLDDALATPADEQRVDLLAGLQIRRPSLARSGFFIDRAGTVVTTAEVGQCADLRIDESHPAEVVFSTDAITVIRPQDRLAPMGAAVLRDEIPRLGSDIAVAGFPFGGSLGAPTLSFGTLADLRGPSGEENMERLEVTLAEGDAGAPVIGEDGTVIGMIVPAMTEGRPLPSGVGLAVDASVIVDALREAGVSAESSAGGNARTPEAVTRLAGDMATLVTCWD